MSATANSLHRKLDEMQTLIVEVRAMLAALDLPDSTIPNQEHRPHTGWRFVRGETSGTYVRDPQGTDRLPSGYIPGRRSCRDT